MKYVKILGLLAVAATAPMAFAASASATLITSPTNTPYTGGFTATSEGTTKLKSFISTIECHSTMKAASLTHGEEVTANAKITELVWGKEGNTNGTCHNSWVVKTVSAGSLEIHWYEEHVGTVTSTGLKVHATQFGVNCVYDTNATFIGTFTDSHKTGGTATPNTPTLHIQATLIINALESSGLCFGLPAEWSGSYIFTNPDKIYIDK